MVCNPTYMYLTNKTHFSFHKERKNKTKLSVRTVNSLLFTPVSDCLDPDQDPHPVGPDRVQTVCFGYLQTTSHRGQDYPHGLISVYTVANQSNNNEHPQHMGHGVSFGVTDKVRFKPTWSAT